MSIKFIILGCGSSLGVPRIDGFFGNCDPKNKKNYRTRCCALIKSKNKNVLIDTSPDLKQQLIKNKINNIDKVFYTHHHADQTHGINELRFFYLKNRKKIDPSDPRGVFIRSASSDLKENQDFTSALKIIISFVGFGTLLAGVIGISNIMVYVVRERTKELGIRKAIGATPKSIVWMVLQESIFITTISGYMGMFAGILFLSSLGNKLEEDFYITDPYVDFNTALFATIMLIIFGGIAGFIPARRAAKLDPAVSLRYE